MKYGDVQKLCDAGLITDEQRRKINEHFHLKEDDGNKFLAIVSMIGAVLAVAGAILVVAAHWDEIPRGVKIAGGLALMLGAHGAGWWLREVRKDFPKAGEALHLLGSGLFLGNIALLGQVYNLVSRPPDAFLLWWLGIAALPWLLRSKAQHVLLLLAFGLWFGLEVNERDSWLWCTDDRQILLFSLLGLVYLGAGWLLRGGAFAEFSGVTEKLGLLIFLIFFYPLTWKDFYGWGDTETHQWIYSAFSLAAILPLAAGIKNLRALTAQWRWTWLIALAGMVAFMASVWFGGWQLERVAGPRYFYWGESWSYLVGTLALFVFCLLQIQVGLQERSPFLVNLGVSFVALDILAAYLDLFGSLARTGVMFLVSGIFLIVFGVYLEKKRRRLMQQLHFQPPTSNLQEREHTSKS